MLDQRIEIIAVFDFTPVPPMLPVITLYLQETAAAFGVFLSLKSLKNNHLSN
jgi:hypothetical protein